MNAQADADPRIQEVWAQLAGVTDPELDEPLTELGFIERVEIDGADRVLIDFRLPTYWCAANFAFLMADDMRRAVETLPWVKHVRPTLLDHMYADEVNAGVAGGLSFKDTFGDLAADEPLDALRDKFQRKAFQRRQEAVLLALLKQGHSKQAVVDMTLAALDKIAIESPEGAKQKPRYRELLLALGWAQRPEDRAFVTSDGAPLSLGLLAQYLRDLRSVRINMEFNGALCRGLLDARYKELDRDTGEPTLADFALGRFPPPGPRPG